MFFVAYLTIPFIIESNFKRFFSNVKPENNVESSIIQMLSVWDSPGNKYIFSIVLFPESGKKNKLRVYYLSWLRNRILHNDPEVEKKQGWITVGELEGCVHYKVGTRG